MFPFRPSSMVARGQGKQIVSSACPSDSNYKCTYRWQLSAFDDGGHHHDPPSGDDAMNDRAHDVHLPLHVD
jgi:hypothetical protein